jgi:hypothetical protein
MTHARPPSRLRAHLVESVSFHDRWVVCECGEVLTIDPKIGPPRPFSSAAARDDAVAEMFRLHRRAVGLASHSAISTSPIAVAGGMAWNRIPWASR